jgi:DNA polymerase
MRWPNHLLTIDFETYWTADYTLSKMSTEEYVRDARFHAFGAAVKYGNAPSRWVDGADLPAFFAGVPWGDVAVLCQHAQFDGLILSHHFGVRPALWVDTLSMARMALPRQRHSLEELARHFELPPKGKEVNLTKGLRELPPDVYTKLAAYSCHDTDLTYSVFTRLRPSIPPSEFPVIDQTIRLFTEPKLRLNKPRARKLLASVIRSKRSALRRLGVTKDQLSSTDKFAALLDERFGIEVEMKAGKPKADGTLRWLPALAKTDPFMKSLLEHDNPDIQALAALRLQVKSTLEETRLYRMLSMHERGPMAVYLKFAGAHTMRWSGGDKMNWQNFPRGSELRKTIEAPPGYVIVVVDLSQIEARMLNTLAEQWDAVDLFANGDPYCTMATDVYERPILKKEHPKERHVGKVLVLGCGYGMGGPKLRTTLRAGALGGPPIIVDLDTAKMYVAKYRARHPKVVQYWGQAETAIQLLDARVENQPWGPMVIDRGYIRLPNGTALDYTGIVREEGEWRMRDRKGNLMRNQFGQPIRLYGGLMTENVDQALSRVVYSQALVEMERAEVLRRWPLVMSTHDEGAFLAPEREAEECQKTVIEFMTRRPSWLPQIPLAAEGGYDVCYSK